jgi:hypothetical protein
MTMAWRCGGRTNKELIENLFKEGLVTSPIVKTAMENVSTSLGSPAWLCPPFPLTLDFDVLNTGYGGMANGR